SEAMCYNFRIKNLFIDKVLIMIFIWGIMVLALLLFLPLFAVTVLAGIADVFRAAFGKDDADTNNGYCRDLQHEIAAERERNT
ncbi:hypothetical protein, partial [Kingella kingae]